MTQRIIKFRIWRIKEKKMYPAYSIYDIEDDGYIPSNDAIVMQFTGLLDRHGKEVFEGDIIDFGGLKPIEIIWRGAGFESKLIPFENSNPIELTQEGMSAFGEIIGNIYEHKNLLNK